MTNWPNIQEYRNFETKFFDDSKRNVLKDSVVDSDLETVIEDDSKAKNNASDFLNNQKLLSSESKIVRCVIRKDFDETFKKLDREDGVHLNHELLRPKPEEPVVDSSLDKIRLQNHLQWKKQKEEEYLRKKEAKKIAQRKKKEEELRLEKVKKQKEKEREEKIREWQEQKVREKEEKKKEKMVIKKLEEELKVTTPVNKEKLIEEWVKLKNKQKQIETEKQAEILRKKEESKALRQTLAELSYRQWKERLKGRMMTLPKNGYQIFGPKPTPVVKEDWNHDFITNSPRDQSYTLQNFKSNTSTNFTFCPGIKQFEDISKNLFYMGDLKNRSSSFYNLKTSKSKMSLFENNEAHCKAQGEISLKEMQPGTIDLKKKGNKNWESDFDKKKLDFIQNDLNKKSDMSFYANRSRRDKFSDNLLRDLNFPTAQGDQNGCSVFSQIKKHSDLLNILPGAQVLPNKKKIELYLSHCSGEDEEKERLSPQEVIQNKQKIKNSEVKVNKEVIKEIPKKKPTSKVVKDTSKENCCSQSRVRSLSLQKFEKSTNGTSKTSCNTNSKKQRTLELENTNVKTSRRSQSCNKSLKKVTKSELKIKGCLVSKSTVKVPEKGDEVRKCLRLAKSKTCSQKRKSRKPDSFEVTTSKSEMKLLEVEHKIKKKLKRRNLSKSFIFSDSPYCAKSFPMNFNKVKAGQRKNTKNAETRNEDCASKAVSD